MREIKEHCGVFGISCTNFNYSVAEDIYHGLMAIQHRGQLFAGLSITSCNGKISSYKNMGLVSKVLNIRKLKIFNGNVGIGHVYYGSKKKITVEDAQPYHFKSDKIEFSITFNGAITNFDEISEKLTDMGRVFIGNSEIELIATLIESLSNFSNDMIEILKLAMNILEGAYSMILLTPEGNLYAVKDPIGYKPLSYSELIQKDKRFYIVSSESCAFDVIGGKLLGEINPGEILKINPIEGITKIQVKKPKKGGICQFEFTYFARPDSIINNISVAEVRYNLGRCLARNENLKFNNTIVVPVPDSGRSAAMGYAWESGIPYEEGLMKNRYIWQLKSPAIKKLNPIKNIVYNKNIILIDDSIISGITLKQMILMLRNAGALSVHVRISCPPIINNCKLNKTIFSNKDHLIAYEKKLNNYDRFDEEMRKYIDADSLKYQTIESLIKTIGLNRNNLCLSCLTEYCLIEDENSEKKEINLDLII